MSESMAALKLPQPPPMAYSPPHEHAQRLPTTAQPLYIHQPDSKLSYGPSPFSPTTSSAPTSPAMSSYPKSPSFTSHGLGKTVSEKTYSSGPSSPASSTHSPAVESAIRDSHHSKVAPRSQHPVLVLPIPVNATSVRDLEKQVGGGSRVSASSHTRTRNHPSSYGGPEIEEDGTSPELQSKALRILIYLSSINCCVSLVVLLYTLLALFATILLQPFRLCTTSPSFRQQIIGFLSPALKIQLAFIYSVCDAEEYSVPLLILVNLLSPVISLGVAGAAWVAAAFWFFNLILGDPDGSDTPRGYNDGRASVLGVRKWWERWLTRALR